MENNIKTIILMFFLIGFYNLVYSVSYTIVDPWDDRVWLNGWYTAAICLNQNENLTPYDPIKPPDLPNGSIIHTVGDLNNYISYGEEGVYYNRPYVYSERCDCTTDEEGHESCSTCYYCRSYEMYTTISDLGFSAGVWELEKYNTALNALPFKKWSEKELIGDNAGVSAQLKNANISYSEAQTLYFACKNSATGRANNYLASTYGDRNVKRMISYEDYLALIDPSRPSLPGHPCRVQQPNANGVACKNYPVKWKEAARGLMTALTKSLEASEKNIVLLKQQYTQLENAGLCDEDYNEKPKSVCIKAKEALSIIDSGKREATYGQLAIAIEKKSEIQKKVYCFPPQFDDYDSTMNYLWGENGFNPRVVQLKNESMNAFVEGNKIYSDYIATALEQKKITDERKIAIAAEHLEWIKEAPTQNILSGTKVGTIDERWSAWLVQKSNADNYLSEATQKYTKKERGYLKEATISAKNAIKNYNSLDGQGESLKADAKAVVQEKEKVVQSLLQQLESFYQRSKNQQVYSYYLKAKQAAGEAQKAETLGEKYRKYLNAIDYARTGLNNGIILENESSALLAQVDDLIKRAEKDNISVETEKILIKNARESGTLDPVFLRDVIENIIVKASIKYGELTERKTRLLSYINLSKECGQDLKGDIEKADKGLVTENGIDYINGVGQLKKISEEYDIVEGELQKCREKIILNSLYIDARPSIGLINIDKPSTFSIFIIIMNLKDIEATHVSVPINIGVNTSIFLSDIITGKENVEAVRNDGKNIILTIKEIKPLKTFSLSIEKKTILAKTLTDETTAIGREDRSTDVKERKIVEFYAGGMIDSQGTTVDGRHTVFVEPGKHTIERTYNLKNAYSKTEQTETSKIGTNLQVRKTIQIKPNIDITILPLQIKVDYQNISGLQITSNNAKIERKECRPNSCDLELKNLQANKTIVVYVEYLIYDSAHETKDIVIEKPSIEKCFGGEKQCGQLPTNFDRLLAEINAATEANDTARVVELKEKLKDMVNEWKIEQENVYKENNELKTKMKTELEQIETTLNNMKEDSKLGKELKARAEEIRNMLKEAENTRDIKQENEILNKKVDKSTEKIMENFLVDSKKEYDELREKLYKLGEKETPLEFILVEQKINELEINSDIKTALELEKELDKAKEYVQKTEKKTNAQLNEMEEKYVKAKQNMSMVIAHYMEEKNEAEGTEWEEYFTVDIDKIEKIKKEVEMALDEKDYQLATAKIEQLQKQKDLIDKITNQLKKDAEFAYSIVMTDYLNKKDSMSAELKKTIDEALNTVQDMINKKSYVKALKKLKDILQQIQQYKPEIINPILIIATGVLVIAAALLYYLKKREMGKEGNAGIKIGLPIFNQRKKEYRRLERINE
ncbi:MAG: hypothetical protein QXY64_00325 [Candidatus Bilamarchaeaceae archaeon]